jgi:hypothetical protein
MSIVAGTKSTELSITLALYESGNIVASRNGLSDYLIAESMPLYPTFFHIVEGNKPFTPGAEQALNIVMLDNEIAALRRSLKETMEIMTNLSQVFMFETVIADLKEKVYGLLSNGGEQ